MSYKKRKFSSFFPILFLFSLLFIISCEKADTNPLINFISINLSDDSCTPLLSDYSTCGEACEDNPLACAHEILSHIQTVNFISRRVLYPETTEQKPNIQTPMHGLFVPTWNNQILNDAINAAIADPFAAVDMPDWSISAKLNDNPGTPGNDDAENLTWATVMYKIPGYCPQRIFPTDDAPCVGGEWFWFLYRGGFVSFEFDASNDSSLPVFGKADTFCIACHSAVADSDWLWITHDLVRTQQEIEDPISDDGHTPGSTGAEFCDDIASLSPEIPADVLHDPATLTGSEAQTMFDCWSWKSFVAHNWPAKDGERGTADTTKAITDSGIAVWQTYKQTYEMFQPQDLTWTLDDKNWDDAQPLPQICIDALEDAGETTTGVLAFELLNEKHQAFGNQFNTLVDQNGNIAVYNLRVNEDEYQYIKDNGYADTGSYSYSGPLGQAETPVEFPDNTTGTTGKGATEIKPAWKELCTDSAVCAPLDDPDRYFTRTVLIYDEAVTRTIDAFIDTGVFPPETATTPATCRVAEVGLTGMHIITKTFWNPQWIWATFEHIDNVPGNDSSVTSNYSYNNTSCANPTPELCLEQRPGIFPGTSLDLLCCDNHQIVANADPHRDNTESGSGASTSLIPNQVTRIDSIHSSAAAMNTIFRTLLEDAGSPLQNYVLISTQWPGGGRLSADDADNPLGISNKLCLNEDSDNCFEFLPPNLRLRNTVIETYQASYCAPDDEDIGNDPVNCTPDLVAINTEQNSTGGCMNCHFSSGTDASYIWGDAVGSQVPLD